MRYRVTCLTPTLVGDGQRLAPIDYMVWKDHVNILDQNRIFRLLAKGPRLESYLNQLKKAEKLDFGSWGGFAQNFAGRRIPFEHASSTQYWERARAENLFIPTFATGPKGPYLPGTALKGAVRTGFVHGQLGEQALHDFASRVATEGCLPRRPGEYVEHGVIGSGGTDSMRTITTADSQSAAPNSFIVYLLRVSTLDSRGGGKFELGWKQAPRGTVKRAEESTPIFAEMAVPGTTFEGEWRENTFLRQPEIAKALRKRSSADTASIFDSVNSYTGQLLQIHKQYAEWTGLPALKTTLDALAERLSQVREANRGCLLPLGWGGGFLSKAAFLNTQDDAYRQILRQVPLYARAIQSSLPFPKTRRIVFLGNQPASLPGFVHLELSTS
jgi:CRISPR-associated protein Csm5